MISLCLDEMLFVLFVELKGKEIELQGNGASEVIIHVVCFLLGNSSYLPAYEMEQIECSETVAYKIQTPGNYTRRKRTAFRTRRKFEIKNRSCCLQLQN